jgi:NADP-dependent 3-hydroxy acid dehydrogenase YdfG
MKEFHGKVAVVTGAASGIGCARAERCVHEGMKVVLAGINEQTLVQTRQELQAPGAQILAIQTDVSKASGVEALAQQTMATSSYHFSSSQSSLSMLRVFKLL